MLRRSVLLGSVALLLSLTSMSPAWGDEVESVPDFEMTRAFKNQTMAYPLFKQFFPDDGVEEWYALIELWNRESGWDDTAKNPNSSAFGIPQGLTRTHELEGTPYMTDPMAQVLWGLGYIRDRYKRPSRALAHHDAENFY